jgi:hypothetical protein
LGLGFSTAADMATRVSSFRGLSLWLGFLCNACLDLGAKALE